MYQRILIVVNDGETAHAALEQGLGLARHHRAEVLFVHVLPNYVVPMSDMTPLMTVGPEQYRHEVEQAATRILTEAAAQARAVGVQATGTMASGVDEAETIARTASERGCGLIVIGSHGRTALQRLIFGSVVTRLITLATMPVLVCKKGDLGKFDADAQALPDDAPAPAGPVASAPAAP